MKKSEIQLDDKSVIRHEVHDDHVVIIIDGGTENKFRHRIDRTNSDANVLNFTTKLLQWSSELDSHLADTEAAKFNQPINQPPDHEEKVSQSG